jgi:hypothetical protein
MAENLDLNINVNTSGAEGSIGSLKKQMREAQAEVIALSEKFGATSKEAIEAAKRAAILRDKISDAKALVDAFNPDAKFKALTASLSGVAGGFGAVQGAMVLFGKESEDVQKTLLKVQSAMAISQGLQSVGESIDSFKQLGAVIRTQVISAFSTLRGAIIATGVGALAIGIGLLIANWNEFVNYIKNSFPQLFKFAETIGDIVQKVTDFVGITSEAKRESDEWVKAIGKITKALDNQIAELEAQGGREDEVYKLKRQRLEYQLQAIKGNSEKEIEQRADLNSKLRVLDLQEQKRKEDLYKKELLDKIENLEKKTELEYNEEIKKYEALKAIREKLGRQEVLDLREIAKLRNEDKEQAEKEAEDRANKLTQGYWGKRTQIQIEGWTKEAEIDRQYKEAQVQAEYALQDAKFEAVSAGLNILASLAGKNEAIANTLFIIDRAMAIAKVVVDTQREIVGYWSNPTWSAFPDGGATVKTAASTAAKIRAGVSIATIAATSIAKFKSGGSAGSVGGGGMPSVSTQAPMMPQLPRAQTTNISQQSINDIGNQAVRAYVVESDVTSNQQRMAAIRQRARFS